MTAGTMKPYLLIAGMFVAVLNGLLLVPATNAYTVPIAAIALVLALFVVAISILGGTKSRATSAPAPVPAVIPRPVPAANQAEAEIVAFFALLQEKGRFVDFLMEDLTSYEDTQVAAAARVIHQGCRQVLQEHFKITAVSEAEEGSQITVPAGYAADEYRVVGKLSGEPPFTGKLIHKGWKTESVTLPRIVKPDEKRLPAIAPAEVELSPKIS
jgi:Domain of unknown function (DUF2760)